MAPSPLLLLPFAALSKWELQERPPLRPAFGSKIETAMYFL